MFIIQKKMLNKYLKVTILMVQVLFITIYTNGEDANAVGVSIYSSDGKLVKRVASDKNDEDKGFLTPAWSRDGSTIAFVNNAEGKLFRANSDGSGLAPTVIKVKGLFQLGSVIISPDGKKVAYSYLDESDIHTAYTVNIDGSGLKKLKSDIHELLDWSPDGSSIAYRLCNRKNCNIYQSNVDGTSQKRITTGDNAVWSSDGKTMAVVKSRHYYKVKIVTNDGDVIRRSKSLPKVATALSVSALDISHDLKKIALSIYYISGKSKIFTIGTNGKNMKEIVSSRNEITTGLQWSPDDKKLLRTY